MYHGLRDSSGLMGQLGSEAVIIQAAHATAPARSSWQTPKARRGRAVKRARTDSDRTITYDPANRPEVANLLLLCSLCSGRTPEEIAGEIGDGGAGRLKQLLIESLNDYLRPLRSRRRELEKEPEYIRGVLRKGIAAAREAGQETLSQVRRVMNMEI